MLSSDWRAPAAYAYAKRIPAAGFAWEYLRRDEEYRRDFHRVKSLPQGEMPARRDFSKRWGLRFRGGPQSIRRPGSTVLAAGVAA